jgi:hypothetical protein
VYVSKKVAFDDKELVFRQGSVCELNLDPMCVIKCRIH